MVQMDHLEDLENIAAFDNLLEAPLGVGYDVFLVGSVIHKHVNDLRSIQLSRRVALNRHESATCLHKICIAVVHY